jgi:hypothetical protein
MTHLDHALIQEAMLALLHERGGDKSICPSEVARKLGSEQGWRELMEPVRCVGRKLARGGVVVFTQRGQVVDPERCKGPVRLRRIGGPDLGSSILGRSAGLTSDD